MALTKEQSNDLRNAVTDKLIAGYSRAELRQITALREDYNCSEGEAYYMFAKEKFDSITVPENAVIYPVINPKSGSRQVSKSVEVKSTGTSII